MDENFESVCDVLNYIFAVIFTLEAILKIYALRSKYFVDGWNLFDFFVVIFTIVIIILTLTDSVEDIASIGMVLRTLRIGRMLRLIKRAKTLQVTFQTLLVSAPSIGSLGTLLIMMIFMFSIVGMSLFSLVRVEDQSIMNYHNNFQNFGSSFLTLIRCATGEAWNMMTFDLGRTNSLQF